MFDCTNRKFIAVFLFLSSLNNIQIVLTINEQITNFRQNPRRNDGHRNRENTITTEVRWIWTAVVKGIISKSAFPSVYIVYVDLVHLLIGWERMRAETTEGCESHTNIYVVPTAVLFGATLVCLVIMI